MTDTPPFTEAWLPGYDGTQFYTRTYGAVGPTVPSAVILFVHGFAEHVGRYEWAHRIWASRGFTVFCYDQRGFGRTALDTKHKSKTSSYGKTCLNDQMNDVEWWVQYLKSEYPGVPLFLMGHSMGGGMSLAFVTREQPPPSPDTVQLLSGVILSSPFLAQTNPAPKLLRWLGEKAALVLPNLLYPAPLDDNDLSHDPAINQAAGKDPMLKKKGSLRGLADMLGVGEDLVVKDYKNWPKQLPCLILHGTEDKIASCKAVEEFYSKLDAQDKKLSLYPNGYHELVNEPEGVKEKFVDECISWVQARLPAVEPEATEGDVPVAKL